MLGKRVRVMKKDHLKNLFQSAENTDDRVPYCCTQNSSLLQAECERLSIIKWKDTEVKTKYDVQKKITLNLYRSLDGDGLKQHSDVPRVHSWISDGMIPR